MTGGEVREQGNLLEQRGPSATEPVPLRGRHLGDGLADDARERWPSGRLRHAVLLPHRSTPFVSCRLLRGEGSSMTARGEAIDDAAERIGFSGVVRIDDADGSTWATAYGDADRAHGIANTTDTIFGLASGGKGFTALAVASLIEDGTLGFDTTARSLLGDDLPLIADEVTVELLLAHRSGIGDYLDEQEWEVTDVVMPVSVHRLVEMEDFVGILDGFPMAFPPDERFAYCNGGFVVLAVLAERAAGMPYRELVRT